MQTTDYIGMYERGNQIKRNRKEQLVALVLAAQMEGEEGNEARLYIQQVMQAAQQGNPDAQRLAQAIQQIAQEMQSLAQFAKEGAKLDYVRKLLDGKKSKETESVKLEKCGGKTKKKVVKKSACGCKLKKLGGHIVEVDGCTELPIQKEGGILYLNKQITKYI